MNKKETTTPFFSIIIPSYNRASLLVHALESIFSQDFDDYEVLVIDDGSTDETRSVVTGIVESNDKVKYLFQQNQGQAAARNYGIAEARGEYVTFLDSDDMWPDDRLGKCHRYISQVRSVDILYGNASIIDMDNNILEEHKNPNLMNDPEFMLLHRNPISLSGSVVARRILQQFGAFNVENRIDEDYELWLKLSSKARFAYIDETLCFWRITPGQLSNNEERSLLTNIKLVDQHISSYSSNLPRKRQVKGRAILYAKVARYYAVKTDIPGTFRYAGTAIRLAPFSIIGWRVLLRLSIELISSWHQKNSK